MDHDTGITIAGVIIGGIALYFTIRYGRRRRSVSVKKEEGKPTFQLVNITPKWLGKENPEKVKFLADLKNVGNIQARDVKVSFNYSEQKPSIRQLIQSEKEIKKSYLPIDGTILPNTFRKINLQKEWVLREGKLWVTVWAMYKFSDEKSEECVFISHVIGDCTDGEQPIFYSYEDLKEDRKAWNDLMSGKGGL